MRRAAPANARSAAKVNFASLEKETVRELHTNGWSMAFSLLSKSFVSHLLYLQTLDNAKLSPRVWWYVEQRVIMHGM